MMLKAITFFVVCLIAGLAQAQPRAELEAWPLGDQGLWRVVLNVDELEDVYGLQVKLVFPEGNLKSQVKKFDHHAAWPEQGKIALRNFIKADSAEYAVSLTRPVQPIALDGEILVMDVVLENAMPTPIAIETLKVSDQSGKVTRIDAIQKQVMIGERKSILPYVVTVSLLILMFAFGWIYKRRSNAIRNSKEVAA